MREPKNYITGNPYTAGNLDKLLSQSEAELFMTFAQGLSIGKIVRKGEKGIKLNRAGKPFTVFSLDQFIDREPVEIKSEVFKEPESKQVTETIKTIEPAAIKTTIKPVKAIKSNAKKAVEFEESPLKDQNIYFVKDGIVYATNMIHSTAFARAESPDGWIPCDTGKNKPTYKEIKAIISEGIPLHASGDIENIIPVVGGHIATLSIDLMKELSVFASVDSMKPAFNAVYVGEGFYVASDSWRLSTIKAKPMVTSELYSENAGYIIPLNIIKQAKSDIDLFLDNGTKKIIVKSKNSYTRLVDGQFPNFKQVIPKEKGTLVTVGDDAIKECKAKSKQPSFKMVVSKDGISYLSSVSGHMVKTIFMPCLSPETPEMGFNSSYMLDAIKFTGTLTYSVIGAMSPIVYRSEDETRTAVVMPIQLKPAE